MYSAVDWLLPHYLRTLNSLQFSFLVRPQSNEFRIKKAGGETRKWEWRVPFKFPFPGQAHQQKTENKGTYRAWPWEREIKKESEQCSPRSGHWWASTQSVTRSDSPINDWAPARYRHKILLETGPNLSSLSLFSFPVFGPDLLKEFICGGYSRLLALLRHKTQGLAHTQRRREVKELKCQSTVSVSLRQPANFPMHGPTTTKK